MEKVTAEYVETAVLSLYQTYYVKPLSFLMFSALRD